METGSIENTSESEELYYSAEEELMEETEVPKEEEQVKDMTLKKIQENFPGYGISCKLASGKFTDFHEIILSRLLKIESLVLRVWKDLG